MKNLFGRVTETGDIAILHVEDGSAVRRIEANIYPVGSTLSTRYEHPEGIILSRQDAELIGDVGIRIHADEMVEVIAFIRRRRNVAA